MTVPQTPPPAPPYDYAYGYHNPILPVPSDDPDNVVTWEDILSSYNRMMSGQESPR